MNLSVVTGEVNGGKTTMLNAICSRLDSRGLSIGGVIQVAPLPNQVKENYILSDHSSGESRLLMSLNEHVGFSRYNRFWIDESTFSWANELIIAAFKSKEVVTIDEIGPLELRGGAFEPSFRSALKNYKNSLIVVIRKNLIDDIFKYFGIDKKGVKFYYSDQNWDEQLESLLD